MVESIEPQCINISTYRPLSGSSYMNLSVQLRSPRRGLINIKNKDQKCFYGVVLGILILQKNIQKELKKPTKNCWKTWLWWNQVSCLRKRFWQDWKKEQYLDQCVWFWKWVGFSNLCFKSKIWRLTGFAPFNGWW